MASVVWDGDNTHASKHHATVSFIVKRLLVYGVQYSQVSTASWSDPHTAQLLTSDICNPVWNVIGEGPCVDLNPTSTCPRGDSSATNTHTQGNTTFF